MPSNLIRVFLVILAVAIFVAPPAAEAGEPSDAKDVAAYVSLAYGYSFGLANTPSADFEGSTDARGNEPLVAAVLTVGQRNATTKLDLKLALASFGRVVEVIKVDQGTTDPSEAELEDAGDVRRSILADITIRRKLTGFGAGNLGLYLGFNSGFLFDAQSDDENEVVPDASSYLLAGPSFYAGVGDRSAAIIDLFAGTSEVMTGLEMFEGGWKWRYTRFRPRVRIQLSDQDRQAGPKNLKGLTDGLVLGLWADLGLDDRYGDTYALFISKAFDLFGPPEPKKPEGSNGGDAGGGSSS